MCSFDTNAALPLWRLTVLADNTVIFFWHHCIGDGTSGLAFHRALLAALNADNTIYKGRETVDIPSTSSIVPAIDSLINVRPSIAQFCRAIFDILFPPSWTRGRSAWTGNPVTADSLDALVDKLNLDREACRRTLEAYNAAVTEGRFDPTVRDGVATRDLVPAKSNWAQRLDTPPFVAYPVTGGITFTFGGVRVNDRAQVLSTSWTPIAGLFACGEMVGGLFHGNYPGGTGLMSGAVFGRLAGTHAAMGGSV